MALNILTELDITSTGDSVYTGFETCQTNHALLDDLFHGYCRRSKFRWKDGDEIYIGPGVYFHEGTANRTLYWNSELTFQLGSGGSNSASDDLGASEWHYIYLDDSAIVTAATNLITNSEILNDTTAPTWSASKHGWYNGNDRCIGAILTTIGSVVREFFHSGEYVQFADAELTATGQTPSQTWTDVTLDIPGFCRLAHIITTHAYVDADTWLMVRVNGQTDANGIETAYTESNIVSGDSHLPMYTDSTQKIEIRTLAASTNSCSVYTVGWYFQLWITCQRKVCLAKRNILPLLILVIPQALQLRLMNLCFRQAKK
jgi:hypothetical protein